MIVKDLITKITGSLNRPAMKATPDKYQEDTMFSYIGDAYYVVTSILRRPVTTDTVTTTTSQEYPLPTDCFSNISGIISLEYDGYPLDKIEAYHLQEMYRDEWKNPANLNGVRYFCKYNDETKIWIVGPPVSGKELRFNYVQTPTSPTSRNDVVPSYMDPYIPYLPDYVLGRLMGNDKLGRGAAKIVEFEQRVIAQVSRDKRHRTRLTGRESFTDQLQQYNRSLARRRRR